MNKVTITFAPYNGEMYTEDYDAILEFLQQFGDDIDIEESEESEE